MKTPKFGKKTAKGTKKYRTWTTNRAYLLIIPGLLLFLALNLYPIVFSVYLAFTNAGQFNIAGGYEFVGLRNFQNVILSENTRFYYVLGRTVLFLATSVPLKLFFGLALALVFNLQIVKGRSILRSLLVLPWIVPAVLSILTWRGLFNYDFGAINGMLQAFGLPRIHWLTDATNAFLAYNVVEVWLAYPFMMTIVLSALQSVPPELYDAARVDGASVWQRLRHISFPLIWRPLLFAVILTSNASFQSLLVPLLLNSGGPARTNEFVMVFGYNTAFRSGGAPGAMGLAAAFFAIVSAIVITANYIQLKLGKLTVE
jgi:arabinogalactan oligomer/maltooligosaccharide transport system permease protein